jgi:hypothetical protein
MKTTTNEGNKRRKRKSKPNTHRFPFDVQSSDSVMTARETTIEREGERDGGRKWRKRERREGRDGQITPDYPSSIIGSLEAHTLGEGCV